MQFRRARRLSSAFTTYQGACLMSVKLNMSSLARESTHPLAGLQVHRAELPAAHRVVEAGLEAALLLLVAHREPVLDEGDAGAHQHALELRAERMNSWYSCSVQNPITRSTPARLYQLRSNSTISRRRAGGARSAGSTTGSSRARWASRGRRPCRTAG